MQKDDKGEEIMPDRAELLKVAPAARLKAFTEATLSVAAAGEIDWPLNLGASPASEP